MTLEDSEPKIYERILYKSRGRFILALVIVFFSINKTPTSIEI